MASSHGAGRSRDASLFHTRGLALAHGGGYRAFGERGGVAAESSSATRRARDGVQSRRFGLATLRSPRPGSRGIEAGPRVAARVAARIGALWASDGRNQDSASTRHRFGRGWLTQSSKKRTTPAIRTPSHSAGCALAGGTHLLPDTASRSEPPTAAATAKMKYQVVESVKRPVSVWLTWSPILWDAA